MNSLKRGHPITINTTPNTLGFDTRKVTKVKVTKVSLITKNKLLRHTTTQMRAIMIGRTYKLYADGTDGQRSAPKLVFNVCAYTIYIIIKGV